MRVTEDPAPVTPPAISATRRLTPVVFASADYRRLWRTGLLYYHAYWFEIVVAGWVVLTLTGSPLAVGLVGFCRMLPMLALGLVLGALADRLRETTLLRAVQVVGMLVASLLATLFATRQIHVWQICLLTSLFGCGWACDFSARRALIAQLSGAAGTTSALSLETMTMQGSKIVATAFGGAVLAFGGPRLAYGWLALVYLAGIVATLGLRRLPVVARRSEAGVSLVQLVRSGWTAVVQTPIVRAVLLVTVVMNLLVFPYQQIIAVIARDILGVGAARMGLLAGADGFGAIVVAGLLAMRTRPVRQGAVFLAGATCVCCLLLVLAVSRLYSLSLGAQIVLGACSGAFGAMQPVLILNAVAPAVRARAMGILAMAIGMAPLGILLSGALSAAFGPTLTLLGMAVLALVLNAGIVARNRILLARPPAPDE
jgi:predicted MFS family arabinose efflux permease